jgi:hypothetical protein
MGAGSGVSSPGASAVDVAADDRLAEQYLDAAHEDLTIGHPMLRAFALDELHRLLGEPRPAPIALPTVDIPDGERSSWVDGLADDLARVLPSRLQKALPAPSAFDMFTTNQEEIHGEP